MRVKVDCLDAAAADGYLPALGLEACIATIPRPKPPTICLQKVRRVYMVYSRPSSRAGFLLDIRSVCC